MKKWKIALGVTGALVLLSCTRVKPSPERIVETVVVIKEVPVPVIVTATPVPVIAYASESAEAPVLFDADSCAPEDNPNGCSFDVGVNPGQVGLAFGWHIAWPKGNLDAGGNGCDLVILCSGWYENLWFLDGRYEVYDVPQEDYEGWLKVLATQRADEQAANYGCPTKTFANIPQWDSELTSPPAAEPKSTPTTQPEACKRRPTGQEKTLRFQAGEAVYGWRIQLDNGRLCDGGECYLPSASSSGEVTSGVICPWTEEIQGVEIWNPTQ